MDVSYLITVFNKENEIKETISWIQNQELDRFDKIEIICIDDLSSDDSIKILESLQRDDQRIRIIKNKKNLGPSKSLNIAAKLALGEYLIPIDGDDFLPKDATQYLLNIAKKYKVKLVFGMSKRLKDIPNKITHISNPRHRSGHRCGPRPGRRQHPVQPLPRRPLRHGHARHHWRHRLRGHLRSRLRQRGRYRRNVGRVPR